MEPTKLPVAITGLLLAYCWAAQGWQTGRQSESTKLGGQPEETASVLASDPLDRLRGEWDVKFLVLGGGIGSGRSCGRIATTSPAAGTVALTFSCSGVKYEMRLRKDPKSDRFLLSLKGDYQITVEDCPTRFSDGLGWEGETQMEVGGKTESVVCSATLRGKRWDLEAWPKAEKKLPVSELSTPRITVMLFR